MAQVVFGAQVSELDVYLLVISREYPYIIPM